MPTTSRRGARAPGVPSARAGFALLAWLSCLAASAGVVYTQPPDGSGTLRQSSWWDPDGSDYDQYVWDDFALAATVDVTQVTWRGGYDPTHFGMGGPVVDFTVAIYPSIAAGSQPDVVSPPLVEYVAGGNAGETPAGTYGGVVMYDYAFTLPVAFTAAAGTKYWLQVEAWQHGIPDWGFSAGTGGTGSYFRRIANVGDIYYQVVPGDAAFSLVAGGVDCAGVADCSGHGLCIAPDTCQCDAGWAGADCSIPAAGRVPDGTDGPPLRVARDAAGHAILSWSASCLPTDTDYEAYEGAIGSFASHVPASCTTGGATTLSLTPQAGDRYFLVVPDNGAREGSYGRTSFGVERPASAAACLPQQVGPCP